MKKKKLKNLKKKNQVGPSRTGDRWKIDFSALKAQKSEHATIHCSTT